MHSRGLWLTRPTSAALSMHSVRLILTMLTKYTLMMLPEGCLKLFGRSVLQELLHHKVAESIAGQLDLQTAGISELTPKRLLS